MSRVFISLINFTILSYIIPGREYASEKEGGGFRVWGCVGGKLGGGVGAGKQSDGVGEGTGRT